MGFGKEIKRLRTASKISAQKLAEKIGIEPEKWKKWEQRDTDPKQEDIEKIETYFGRTIDALIKLQRLPIVHKSPFELEEGDSAKYLTKDDLIKSLQETIESQKKTIKFLEYQLSQYMPKDGKDLFEISEPTVVKKTTAKT